MNDEVRNIMLKDNVVASDRLSQLKNEFNRKQKVFWTEVTAVDETGRTLFSKRQNETVLGGALTVLEKLCGIKSDLKVASINHILGINDIVDLADSSATDDDILCLWGIGIGGSGDAFGSRLDVKFYEREVGQNGYSDQMIPFRVVNEPFPGTDDNAKKYFLMNQREDGLYEYYLKAFEMTPFTKVLWQDGAEGEDGTPVPSDVYNTNRSDKIEAFVEMHLQITKRDGREYFERLGAVEKSRINTIALFTGRRYEVSDGRFDYTNVKMFSKLTFDNEALQNAKTINFTYRIYVA